MEESFFDSVKNATLRFVSEFGDSAPGAEESAPPVGTSAPPSELPSPGETGSTLSWPFMETSLETALLYPMQVAMFPVKLQFMEILCPRKISRSQSLPLGFVDKGKKPEWENLAEEDQVLARKAIFKWVPKKRRRIRSHSHSHIGNLKFSGDPPFLREMKRKVRKLLLSDFFDEEHSFKEPVLFSCRSERS